MKATKVHIFETNDTAERILDNILQKTCDKPRISLNIDKPQTFQGAEISTQQCPPYFITFPQIQLQRENAKYFDKRLWKKGTSISFEGLQWVMEKLNQMSSSLNNLPVDCFQYFQLYLDLHGQVDGFGDMVIYEPLKSVITERFESIKFLAQLLFDRLDRQSRLIEHVVECFHTILPESSADEIMWFYGTITKNGCSYLLQIPSSKSEDGWFVDCKIDLNGFLLLMCILNEDKLGALVRKTQKWGAGFSSRLAVLAETRIWSMQFASLMMCELPKLKDYLDFHTVLCRHQLDVFQNNENNKRTYILTILFGILALIATIPSWLQI